MKTISLLAAVMIMAAPAFAEGTGSNETTGQGLALRKLSGTARTTRHSENLQLADAQSVTNATMFATNLAAQKFFEYTGLYLTLGGGYARLKAGNFSQTTSYGEVLKATDTTDGVGFGRVELYYQFDENWELGLGATRYGSATVQLAFPKYPNITSLLPLPDYRRHVMKYRTMRYSLTPTYSIEAGDYLRLRVSAGVTCNKTDSHVEATYYAWFSGRPNGMFSENYATESMTSWSGLVACGIEYAPVQHISIALSAAYAPYNIKVPASRSLIGLGYTQPTRSSVRVDSLEAMLSVNFRR